MEFLNRSVRGVLLPLVAAFVLSDSALEPSDTQRLNVSDYSQSTSHPDANSGISKSEKDTHNVLSNKAVNGFTILDTTRERKR